MSVWYGTDRSILTQDDQSKRAVDAQRNVFAYEIKDLQAWSIGNWNQIPEPERRLLLDHLREVFNKAGDGRYAILKWGDQVKAGVEIGSDDHWFHHGVGTWVRNRLRDVLTDDRLPWVRQPDGSMARNYDDFYIGAIHALVTEPEVVS